MVYCINELSSYFTNHVCLLIISFSQLRIKTHPRPFWFFILFFSSFYYHPKLYVKMPYCNSFTIHSVLFNKQFGRPYPNFMVLIESSLAGGMSRLIFVDIYEMHSLYLNVVTNNSGVGYLCFMVLEFFNYQYHDHFLIWVFWNGWVVIACLSAFLIMEGQQ